MHNAPGIVNVPGTAGALGISVPSAAMMGDEIGRLARASEIDNGICLEKKVVAKTRRLQLCLRQTLQTKCEVG